MTIHVSYSPPAMNAALAVHAAAEVAAREGAQVLLDMSRPLVPVDTGALAASGQVTDEDGPNAAVSYGQADGAGRNGRDTADYAVPVHERMDAQHTTGQAKFLETAMHANAEKVAEAVVIGLRKALG